MVRTQIQLEEEQVVLLKKMAAEHHASMAEMIRRAVDHFAQAAGAGGDRDARERALRATGRFRSGARDLGSRHDAHLGEALGP